MDFANRPRVEARVFEDVFQNGSISDLKITHAESNPLYPGSNRQGTLIAVMQKPPNGGQSTFDVLAGDLNDVDFIKWTEPATNLHSISVRPRQSRSTIDPNLDLRIAPRVCEAFTDLLPETEVRMERYRRHLRKIVGHVFWTQKFVAASPYDPRQFDLEEVRRFIISCRPLFDSHNTGDQVGNVAVECDIR